MKPKHVKNPKPGEIVRVRLELETAETDGEPTFFGFLRAEVKSARQFDPSGEAWVEIEWLDVLNYGAVGRARVRVADLRGLARNEVIA